MSIKDWIELAIILIFTFGVSYLQRDRLKKFLCKRTPIYEDGKLKVRATTVFVTMIVILISISATISIAEALWGFVIKNPTQIVMWITVAVIILLTLLAVAFVLAKIAEFLWHRGLQSIAIWLTQRMELTCEKITFSNEVKTIFARIEGLGDVERKE